MRQCELWATAKRSNRSESWLKRKRQHREIGFEQQIWSAADKLRGNIDASEYKNVVLGLIFLKYISDKFDQRYQELVEEGESFEEDRDEYLAENIFFVPESAAGPPRQQARYLNKIGLIQNANTPVFCNSVGTWLDPTRLSNWWKHFRHENNFPGLKLHELRHTQATLLLANGVDVKTVQNRLGHANASITLDWYAHPIPEKDEQAATILGSLMQPQTLITPVKTA